MLIIGNGLTCVLEQEATYTVFPCFCFTHTNSVSLKSSRMRKGGSSALMKYSCQCVWKCMLCTSAKCVRVIERENVCVCRQMCVEHAAYQWRFAQQLCTDTVSGRGMERGLGWGEERRGREQVQQSEREREKVRATHQIERDTESRRRGPLDFCQGFPATAEAGIDSFFPSSQGICLFHCLPWEFCHWESCGEERKRVEERSAAEKDDVPPPSLNAEVRATLEGSGKVDHSFGLQTFLTGERKR